MWPATSGSSSIARRSRSTSTASYMPRTMKNPSALNAATSAGDISAGAISEVIGLPPVGQRFASLRQKR